MKRLLKLAEVQVAFDQVMADLAGKHAAFHGVARHGTAAVAQHLGAEGTEEVVRLACLAVCCAIDADAIRARLAAGVTYPQDTDHEATESSNRAAHAIAGETIVGGSLRVSEGSPAAPGGLSHP